MAQDGFVQTGTECKVCELFYEVSVCENDVVAKYVYFFGMGVPYPVQLSAELKGSFILVFAQFNFLFAVQSIWVGTLFFRPELGLTLVRLGMREGCFFKSYKQAFCCTENGGEIGVSIWDRAICMVRICLEMLFRLWQLDYNGGAPVGRAVQRD